MKLGVRGEQLAQAAREVARLAGEHARDLDRFAALAISQGLRGPGAHRLADEYGGVRRRLHSALDHAWNSLAIAARRDDGSPGPAPDLPSGPLIAGRGGSTVGIDAGLLRKASRAADEARTRLGSAATRLGSILATAGVDDSPTAAVRAAAAWAHTQSSDLRHRADLTEGADRAITDVFADALTAGTLAGTDQRLSSLTGAELAAYAELQRIQSATDRATRTAAWWSRLPQTTRDHLTEAAPNVIGSLDGLPATARDKANRIFMATEKKRLETLVHDPLELNKPGGPQQNTWASQQLKAIKAIETRSRLASEAPGAYPRVYVLAFDTVGPGHIAVSLGDPDTADNVSTFIPGFGTTMADTAKNTSRVALIQERANAFAPGQSTASIYWLGYDPPGPDGTAVFTAFERQAATARRPLGGFMRGLEAARGDSGPAHTTILGHSYGSLAAGKTAVAFPHLADEMVFIGSPGVSVEKAEQLGIDPKHVWASAAPDDSVARVLPPRGTPLKPEFWLDLAADHGPFGTRPTSPMFGGKTFYADQGGHSGYWDNKSPSLKNIGRIVVGQEPGETRTG